MIIFLTIFQYLIQSITDIMDKFLISKRKIEPVSYTFFTVVTGMVLLVAWPWVYESISGSRILLNLLSGAIFSLSFYVFFTTLSKGEVSRVVPFIFGLVPVFDLIIGTITGRNVLSLTEVAAFFLLVPGALIISYNPKNFSAKFISLKVLSALLFSINYAVWQYAARDGSTFNHLMWNRFSAGMVLVILLVIPLFRKRVFAYKKVQKRKHTGGLFLIKQLIGGAHYLFFSMLIVHWKISIVNAMQGFRYVFLFFISLFLSKKYRHILEEQFDVTSLRQKVAGLVLITLGTIILFI